MGGKTSAASHNKYNAKAYDRVNLTVPKGQKEEIQEYAQEQGMSVNGYINNLIQADMGNRLTPGGVYKNPESEPSAEKKPSCSISPSLKRVIKKYAQDAVQNFSKEECAKLECELSKLIYESFDKEARKLKANAAKKVEETKVEAAKKEETGPQKHTKPFICKSLL